jgi:hypothetical protein
VARCRRRLRNATRWVDRSPNPTHGLGGPRSSQLRGNQNARQTGHQTFIRYHPKGVGPARLELASPSLAGVALFPSKLRAHASSSIRRSIEGCGKLVKDFVRIKHKIFGLRQPGTPTASSALASIRKISHSLYVRFVPQSHKPVEIRGACGYSHLGDRIRRSLASARQNTKTVNA